jgi:hypothetical protein
MTHEWLIYAVLAAVILVVAVLFKEGRRLWRWLCRWSDARAARKYDAEREAINRHFDREIAEIRKRYAAKRAEAHR